MKKKILAIVILLAFGACGFTIYGQQNEIRQWKERAAKYQLENIKLQEQVKTQGKNTKKQSAPVNYSYSDSSMDELERYEYESRIQSLESDLEYERLQRDIDRSDFEMNRYNPSYTPY